ncbi:MAG: transcriptional regulator [Chitinophagaceae bacterium]|nr:MAG: transcriptional regulator [Chitinophagaceae bacterium]
MKQRKIPEDLDCGLTISMKVFGAKWKPCIIDTINRGFTRPSQMHREIASAPPRVIDMQLRELELVGIVTKKVFSEVPLRTEYYLTDTGKSLLPIIHTLNIWGEKNKQLVAHLIADGEMV